MTPPITRDGDGVFVDSDGVKRRTILAGAAWSIPVISMATAAPAFAATNDLKLAFDKSTYNGTACGTISGAKVTATRNGVAAPGESITVSLADGYTFNDGSTSYTATSGADGSISLPDIKVPAQGGNSTMTATSGSTSTSAAIDSPSAIAAYQNNGEGTNNKMSPVPIKSKAIGDGTFLADNGDLYYSNKVIATGVKSAAFDYVSGSSSGRVNYVNSDGAYQYSTDSGTTNKLASVPTSSTAIGDGTFLADNGDLYYGNKVIATGVKSAAFDFTADTSVRINYVNSDGAYQYISSNGGSTNKQSNVPTSSKAIGDVTFLADNGDLYYKNSIIATGVKSAAFDYTADNGPRINYVNSNGAYQYADGTVTRQSNVPTSSTAIGDLTFLADNGDLYYNNKVVAKKVTTAAFDFVDKQNYVRINYIGAPACK